MKNIDTLVTGIDIGSTKIAVSMVKISNQVQPGNLTPLISFAQKSKGFSNQTILNIDWLEESILNTLHTAEKSAKVNVKNVYISVPTCMLNSYIIENAIDLSAKPIDNTTIQKILGINFNNHIPKEEEVIHIIPIKYQLDDMDHILDPRKMIGKRLRAKIHLIGASKSFLNNMRILLNHYDLKIRGFVANPYACGLALLNDIHPETAVIDFGAENTSIGYFVNNNIMFLKNIPTGSLTLTQDIAKKLGINYEAAERLKIYQSYVSENIALASPDYVEYVNPVIMSRIEELTVSIYELLKHEPNLSAIMLTGGGSQLGGLADFWSRCFNKSIKVMPNPTLTTSVGLLQYGYYDYFNKLNSFTIQNKKTLWNKLKNLFMEDL